MEVILKSYINNTTMNEALKNLSNCIDMTKLDNVTLKEICDPSKMSVHDLLKTIDLDNHDYIFKILPTLTNLNDFKLIEFEKMTDNVQQKILGYLLVNKWSIDYITTVLDKMKTINYGIHYTNDCPLYKDINPLINCCYNNREPALVQLLVEKYGANIEHPCYADTTAIMFAAQNGNFFVTKYLYDKGAKLLNNNQCIYTYAKEPIKILLKKWEAEKTNSTHVIDIIKEGDFSNANINKQVNNNELKENYEKLKLEIIDMKRSLENVAKMFETFNAQKTC